MASKKPTTTTQPAKQKLTKETKAEIREYLKTVNASPDGSVQTAPSDVPVKKPRTKKQPVIPDTQAPVSAPVPAPVKKPRKSNIVKGSQEALEWYNKMKAAKEAKKQIKS